MPKRFKPTLLNDGERDVLTYLGELGFQSTADQAGFMTESPCSPEKVVLYHRPHGFTNPDFSLFAEGREVGVVEVEDLDPSVPRGFDEHGLVDWLPHFERAKRKIKDASIQLFSVLELPTLIVVRDSGHTLAPDLMLLMAMVFGWPGMSLQVGPRAFSEPAAIFGDDGKFTGSQECARNMHVSAFAWFGTTDVTFERYGIREALERVWSEALVGASITELDAMAEPVDRAVAAKALREDIRHSFKVILNPWAAHPWPAELWGPYDRVYRVHPETRTPDLVHDGLRVIESLVVS